jgi:hypothetical protein
VVAQGDPKRRRPFALPAHSKLSDQGFDFFATPVVSLRLCVNLTPRKKYISRKGVEQAGKNARHAVAIYDLLFTIY